MKYYYDMHIHSALSPCADNDMTPNNIVNMSLLKGLDIIAVTDHNSCGNVAAVCEAAKGTGLLVIPGMELATSEEVHIACYFKTVSDAEKMWNFVKENSSGIKNRPEIFGEQYYMDKDDNVTGSEEELLVTASKISFKDAFSAVREFEGAAVPAHIDKTSYSVLSNLGFIPPDVLVSAVEITAKNRLKMENEYAKYKILTSSDAHTLGDIAEKQYFMDISDKSTEEVIKNLLFF